MVDEPLPQMRCDFYVYVIFRLDGAPCYVGKGRGDRWKRHATSSHNQHLARIFVKDGGELPVLKVREGLTDAQAMETEVAFIAAIGRGECGPLVNKTDGGEGASGHTHTPESKAKMAAIGMLREYSEATRQKMSAAKRGKKLTPAHIAKVVASLTGSKRTPETRERMVASQCDLRLRRGLEISEKIAASKRGIPRSAEARAKMSVAKLGKKISPEHKAKSAAFHRGRKRSVEARANIAAGAKLREARKIMLKRPGAAELGDRISSYDPREHSMVSVV